MQIVALQQLQLERIDFPHVLHGIPSNRFNDDVKQKFPMK